MNEQQVINSLNAIHKAVLAKIYNSSQIQEMIESLIRELDKEHEKNPNFPFPTYSLKIYEWGCLGNSSIN